MKSKIKIVFGLFLFMLVSTVFAQTYSTTHEKVKNIFKSREESTAKDAVWTSESVFKVGVIHDGSNRNGYASYVCEVLYENGLRGKNIWVQIVDIAKLSNEGKWVTIGEARCK